MSEKEGKETVTDIAFKLFDMDRDGFITREEFTQVHIKPGMTFVNKNNSSVKMCPKTVLYLHKINETSLAPRRIGFI